MLRRDTTWRTGATRWRLACRVLVRRPLRRGQARGPTPSRPRDRLRALWVFQVLFQFLAPVVDFLIAYATVGAIETALPSPEPSVHPYAPLLQLGAFFGLFLVIDLIGAVIAYRLDRENPRELWWLVWQRFVYRQLMYVVLWRAIVNALSGARARWLRVTRSGSLAHPPLEAATTAASPVRASS